MSPSANNPSPIDDFGAHVFGEQAMRHYLPSSVFQSLQRTIHAGRPLDPASADIVASAMKDWALHLGATHYCHWFQPMNGLTAEKHDSFVSPAGNGNAIMEFSGKNLVQGEPDASSFPSGGLRATFEARGYTGWDTTSPVFVKSSGDTMSLYIPSVFCSYNGEALDKKTPLIRSMEAVNRQALRLLAVLGDGKAGRVVPTLGAEQEYFLVDREFVARRPDLLLTGRTLAGARPPKGQELEDQYFGAIPERVASFMSEVNQRLWRLGVSAKTQHNENAPGQYELAPIFTTANIAADWNQLTMSTLKETALRHGFVCLLHEKPFAGVNGSGKHLNWSLATNDGRNLLDPGHTPHENVLFLVFVAAVIRAVDRFAPLLRAAVAVPGNDHRLGGSEAPPPVISIFLGERMTEALRAVADGNGKGGSGETRVIELGVDSLPRLPKDSSDRNRTSPFAFTGDKFEFRMAGSSQSPSDPITYLNTAVADALSEMADFLEKAGSGGDSVRKILKSVLNDNGRVIFNGDNYSREWLDEAVRRGLPVAAHGIDAIEAIRNEEMAALFARHQVLSASEFEARIDIMLEQYVKTVEVEAKTLVDMCVRRVLPAAYEYAAILGNSFSALRAVGEACGPVSGALHTTVSLFEKLDTHIAMLTSALEELERAPEIRAGAAILRERIMPEMEKVRRYSDGLEKLVKAAIWPFPGYSEMLFNV